VSQSPPMRSPHAVVVANGEYAHAGRLTALARSADLIIAADGGANWLAEVGIRAHVLIGDLDSASPAAQRALREAGCEVLRFPAHKDETDTELALAEAAARGAAQITLLGAIGGRIDHTLANILLLAMPRLAGVPTYIYDGQSWLSLVRGYAAIRGAVGDLVSLIPIAGDAEGVLTEGLEYALHGETLRFGPARGISNVLTSPEASVTVQAGLLILVHTPRVSLEEGAE